MLAVRYVAILSLTVDTVLTPTPQIRANSLSGDCKFTRELQRGFVAFSKQHQVHIAQIYPC